MLAESNNQKMYNLGDITFIKAILMLTAWFHIQASQRTVSTKP